MFDHHLFKQQFPLFSHPENSDLVYFDNAATTQRPKVVIDAVADFYSRFNANTHRSSHRLARAATQMVESARDKMASFIGARSDEIVFTRGATESLNLLANVLASRFEPGDEIVLSYMEHHANIVPWQMLADKVGAKLVFIETVTLANIQQAVNKKTKLVSITAASNALGEVFDTQAIGRYLATKPCLLIVDASQLMAHQVINVEQLQCDFLLASAHKFYGPTGVGFLFGRQAILHQLPPWQGGGEMIKTVTTQSSDFAQGPQRFEAGTASLAAIAGLSAALDFVAAIDRQAMRDYEQQLLHRLVDGIKDLPITLLSSANNNVGILAFVPQQETHVSAYDIAHWLDGHDIAVRVGHHCAQPLVRHQGFGSTVRISLAGYNSPSDVDKLIATLSALDWFDENNLSPVSVDTNDFPMDDLSSLKLDALQSLNSWQQRYKILTRWASMLQQKPCIHRHKYLVPGCETELWLKHRIIANRHQFIIDAQSRVIKGLAVLLLMLFNDKTSEEIRYISIDQIFADLGLDQHLSPSRANGFRALVEKMLSYVNACR